VASGRGVVHSHLTHHHPPLPGYAVPVELALVDREEGMRLVAQAEEPLAFGDVVEVGFRRVDDELTLPVWRRRGGGAR
jgi:uncharacterized OB-fold protein